MHSQLHKSGYKPEQSSRKGELIAWAGAILVNGAWLLLIFFNQPISYWLPILGIPLLLVALGMSLANWIDRKTFLWFDDAGIHFYNGLRSVNLQWDEIQEVRVLPAQWGEKVQVFGDQVYFGFHTLGEVRSNGKLLGRTGFVDGDRILEHILEESGLSENPQLQLGDLEGGYYYSRH